MQRRDDKGKDNGFVVVISCHSRRVHALSSHVGTVNGERGEGARA